MKEFLSNIKGDRGIWSYVGVIAIFSFMPVLSSSTNLAFLKGGDGNTASYFFKHIAEIITGFVIIYLVHKIPYLYYRQLSILALPLIWGLLVLTLMQKKVIDGANASRWLRVPVIGITFQTSSLASIVVMIYAARYFAKKREQAFEFKASVIEYWLPVGIAILLMLPPNFSTAALLFLMTMMIAYIGKYPIKYIGYILGISLVGLTFFVVLAINFPKAFPNRVHTWVSRIESFTRDDSKIENALKSTTITSDERTLLIKEQAKINDDKYQIEKSKTAIATGGLYGLGPGKSVQKHFLPQSSCDFIYAIIVEEFGLIIGGLGVLLLYMLLFFRFIVVAHKTNSLFGKLLVVGLGFPIIFQALINMCVAVGLMPVTGQPMALMSSGGSAIWMTCFSLGIIINVSKKEEEIVTELKEKEKRNDTLQKMIDAQIKLEEDAENQDNDIKNNTDYSIDDEVDNPLLAIKSIRKIKE